MWNCSSLKPSDNKRLKNYFRLKRKKNLPRVPKTTAIALDAWNQKLFLKASYHFIYPETVISLLIILFTQKVVRGSKKNVNELSYQRKRSRSWWQQTLASLSGTGCPCEHLHSLRGMKWGRRQKQTDWWEEIQQQIKEWTTQVLKKNKA